MFSKVVKTAPRLLNQAGKLNKVAVFRLASNQSAPVVESFYKPSGNIPRDDSYHQIPVKLDGKDYVYAIEDLQRPYPFVPTLQEISIENTIQKLENPEAQAEEEETDPRFQVKTLEDKVRCWIGPDMPTKYDDQRASDRDLVNYPRITPLPIEMSKTRLYFLPESWFKFFESKTGRSGGYIFGTTFGIFLLSKELFVFNPSAFPGVALTIIGIVVVKNYGREINNLHTGAIHKEKQGWIDWQDGMKKLLKEHLTELKQVEDRSVNPGPIYDAKRESLQLQQEAEYRRRLMEAYNEVMGNYNETQKMFLV